MSEAENEAVSPEQADTSADTTSGTQTAPQPTKAPPRMMPQWKVLLHNDDVNNFEHVMQTILMLTTLSEQDAELRMIEAHETGVALLLVTHKERAELYVDQFTSRSLTVTIEPADE